MPRIDEDTKTQRKERAWIAVQRHPRGVTEAEVAEFVNMTDQRRTVNNYLRELEDEGKVYKDGRYWFPLDYAGTRLKPFDLQPEEAFTLYLATRLLTKQQDKRNEPAETALFKLAHVLTSDAGVGQEIVQAARELANRGEKSGYQTIYRTIIRGYLYRKWVRIRYHPAQGEPFETEFATYLIEPSAIGFSTYIIGKSSIVNDLRSYKLERIEEAALIPKAEYIVPEDFPGLDILRNAWSVIGGEKTTRVVLRFNPRVKKRVLETVWHPSQQYEEENDGRLRWWVDVADTTDMKPWIQGWGSQVEVLKPETLRASMEKEVRQMAKIYRANDNKLEDELIAHWRKRDQEAQLLLTHLAETADLAEGFAKKIGLPQIGKILGLLHDFGKASKKYQLYLRSGEGLINPDEDAYIDPKAQKGKIDHSTAGAQLVYQKLASRGHEGKFLAQFLALAIASHHSGLIDCLTPDGKNNFQRRMDKLDEDTHFSEAVEKLPGIVQQLEEILTHPIEQQFFKRLYEDIKEVGDSKETLAFKRGLLARILLSCLLDADRLNTADFENPRNELLRNYGKYHPWSVLIERLEFKFDEYARITEQMDKSSRAYEVNQLRAQVVQACLDFSQKPKGIYRLTVPTGGAKTMSSLRFALHHAEAHKMDRIFYVVPYITIIDQNADEVRKVLEDRDKNGKYLENVIFEHHSNLTPEKETRRHNLLAENWDAPVVFTTQVQFLESLFSAGTRDARRMHQLANSVIILDEVQTVPIKMIHLFNVAMRFLVHDCGATVLLCTATQPPLENTGNDHRGLTVPLENHIIQNEQELFEKLKRVEVYDRCKPGGWTGVEIGDLAEYALNEKGSVLLVLNTRASASMLYQEIKARNLAKTYHLSTNMCPAHRLDMLEEVKAKLKADEPVICVSTQLIEAGVDIDFGAVIRALAGLDSIAQSAGRCNRHGWRDGMGSVWVVNPVEENLDRLPDIKTGREKTQTVFDEFKEDAKRFGNDRIGLNAIAGYYRYYFRVRKNEMDYPVDANSTIERDDDLFSLLSSNTLAVKAHNNGTQAAPDILLRQSFQSAGKLFHIIDSVTRGVVVPYKDGKTIITDLCSAPELEKQRKLLKKAQRYSVNLFAYQFDKLARIGVIKEVQPGTNVYYLDEQYYSNEFGWSDEPVGDMKLLIAE